MRPAPIIRATKPRLRAAAIRRAEAVGKAPTARPRGKTVRIVSLNLGLLLPLAGLACFSSAAASGVMPATASRPGTSCEREIASAAQRYGIPLAVFYAVGLNETGTRGRLQPFSMNIDGRSTPSASLAEALARFRQAKAAGARMIDIGCMQINHHYHGEHFASVEAMFDPAGNIDYAARFLRDLKEREHTWTMAVARYNAGPNNNPAQKLYVCKVLAKMVTSGFGAWTESAKNFCFNGTPTKLASP